MWYIIEKEAKNRLTSPLDTNLNEAFEEGAKYILEAFRDSVKAFRYAFNEALKNGEDLESLEGALQELEKEPDLFQ